MANTVATSALRMLALLASVLPGWASSATAHELGKGQVLAVIERDGRYTINVTVDPDDLLTRLEALSGRVPEPAATIDEQARRIRDLLTIYRDRTTLVFDDARVAPDIAYVSPHERPEGVSSTVDRGPAGLITLHGQATHPASQFRFGTSMMLGSYALTVKSSAGEAGTVHWLTAGEISEPFLLEAAVPMSVVTVAAEYVPLGFTHILPKGLDHILFVVGLFLLASTWRALLAQVTAFTIAHSLTLALAIAGVVRVSPAIVEPLIALSIAYVAVENLTARHVSPWRIAVVFLFGLLHGLGFAGVLSALGLPPGELVTALVSFNVGVELGQLTVVAAAWVLVFALRSRPATYRRFVVAPASVAIAAVGLYWTFERLGG